MVRAGAAIASVVLAILFGWTVYASFAGPDPVVVPTRGVIDAGPEDALPAGEAARAALTQRTRLQRWRTPGDAFPGAGDEAAVSGTAIDGEREASPETLAAEWLTLDAADPEIVRDHGFVRGVVNLPDPRAEVLQQPQGRDWRRLHNAEITYGGGWVIFGFSLLLALFLLIRGRIPLKEGRSGQTILRFNSVERANHWITAASFVVIALTGLILLYGQFFMKPGMGAEAYRWLATGSAYAHMAFMVPFILGLVVMIAMWTVQNLPSKVDLEWLKRGGGFFSDKSGNPPARRFNAGQKLIFWAVFLGGLALIVTGITLMFPFFWADIQGMQWVQAVHAAVGLVMIAIIIGHIYIGTVGMEHAIHAMWSGRVDRNWVKEHHSLWLQEIERRTSR